MTTADQFVIASLVVALVGAIACIVMWAVFDGPVATCAAVICGICIVANLSLLAVAAVLEAQQGRTTTVVIHYDESTA